MGNDEAETFKVGPALSAFGWGLPVQTSLDRFWRPHHHQHRGVWVLICPIIFSILPVGPPMILKHEQALAL